MSSLIVTRHRSSSVWVCQCRSGPLPLPLAVCVWVYNCRTHNNIHKSNSTSMGIGNGKFFFGAIHHLTKLSILIGCAQSDNAESVSFSSLVCWSLFVFQPPQLTRNHKKNMYRYWLCRRFSPIETSTTNINTTCHVRQMMDDLLLSFGINATKNGRDDFSKFSQMAVCVCVCIVS